MMMLEEFTTRRMVSFIQLPRFYLLYLISRSLMSGVNESVRQKLKELLTLARNLGKNFILLVKNICLLERFRQK